MNGDTHGPALLMMTMIVGQRSHDDEAPVPTNHPAIHAHIVMATMKGLSL